MLSPNCERISVGLIQGVLAVVVHFESGFSVWAPVSQIIDFDNGLKCQDVTDGPGGGPPNQGGQG